MRKDVSPYFWAECGPTLESRPVNPCEAIYTLCVEAEDYDRMRHVNEKLNGVNLQAVAECEALRAEVERLTRERDEARERTAKDTVAVERLRAEVERLTELVNTLGNRNAAQAVAFHAEVEQYKVDAERYRWIRVPHFGYERAALVYQSPEALDGIIDAALRA